MIDEKVLIERLLLESAGCNVYKLINPNIEDVKEFNAYKKCFEIVKQLAEEQKEKLMLKNCIDGQEIEPCGRPRVYMGMEDLIELEAYRDFGTLHQIRALNDRYHQLIEERLNNGWIPCSERLPELTEGTECFKQSECCLTTLKWWDGDMTESVGWYNQSGVWNEDSKNCKVVAWMPLPAPYQPKGEQHE